MNLKVSIWLAVTTLLLIMLPQLVHSQVVCKGCSPIIVVNTKKAKCLEQQYDSLKKDLVDNKKPYVRVDLAGCPDDPKLNFRRRGVAETIGTPKSRGLKSKPGNIVFINASGLECLKDRLKALAGKLDPRRIINMEHVCQ